MSYRDIKIDVNELPRLLRETGEPEALLPVIAGLLQNFSPQEIYDGLHDGFPDPPLALGTPGPHALISPDDVIVCVLQAMASPDDIRRIVALDCQTRYGRAEMNKLRAAGASPDQLIVRCFQVLKEMKGKYRVESLAGGDRSERSR